MASIKHYANGLGGTTGSVIATGEDVQLSGAVYYVGNAVTGNSDANAGTERTLPFATLAHAVSVYVANDTIVVLAGHSEAISSTVTMNRAATRVVGEGSGSTVPRFTCAVAGIMIDITAACVYMDNFAFPASTAASTGRVRISADAVTLNNLSFECGASDTNRALSFAVVAGGTCKISNTTFTSVASQPAAGFEVLNAITAIQMENVTFDGGSFGWSSYAFKGTAAVFGMTATGINLLNGSHVLLPTTSNGFLQVEESTGDSRIDWTA